VKVPIHILSFLIAVDSLLSVHGAEALLADRSGKPIPFQASGGPAKLLVIAPPAFAGVLQPLIAHKNQTGMSALLVTIESLREGFPGKDDPEKIKRGIAYACEKLDTRYVMLVGDASLVPVRYRQVQQVPKDAPLDGTYNPSELYYANLYQGHMPGDAVDDPRAIRDSGVFDSWDSNGNHRFNEQHWKDDALSYNPDRVDGCPDVALGRLPAHTVQEVRNYVAKVIRYESGDFNAAGFGDFTFIADKGYGGSQQMCDDIITGSIAIAFPKSSVFEKLYLNCSPNEFVGAPWARGDFAAIDAATTKSWWITYLGHAGPRYWAIYENGRGYDDGRVGKLKNAGVLPVVFTIGCESGMFMSYAPSETYHDQQQRRHKFVWHGESRTWDDQVTGENIKAPLTVPQPYAYDFPGSSNRTFACSWLMSSAGGAIAFFGETLVCEDDKGHDLVKELFLRYGAGDRVLGDLWLYGQRKYWINNRASENVFRHPRIYLGIMTLFGDPSLRLPSSAASDR
jgi:hypothetical protein